MISTSNFLMILTIATSQLYIVTATSEASLVRTKRHCPCAQFHPSPCTCQPGLRPFCTCVRPTVRYSCACSPPPPSTPSCHSTCQRTCLEVCASGDFGPSCPEFCSSSCAQSCMHQLGITRGHVPMPRLIAMSRQCLPDCQQSCQNSCTSLHPLAFCAPLCRVPCERKCSQLVPVPAVKCIPNCRPRCSPQCLQRLYIEVELSAASQLWQPNNTAASGSASADLASVGQEETRRSTQISGSTASDDASLKQSADQTESSSDSVDEEESHQTTVRYPTLIHEAPEESVTGETTAGTTEPSEPDDHQEASVSEADDFEQPEIVQLPPTDTTTPEEYLSTDIPESDATVLQDTVDPSERATKPTDLDVKEETTQGKPQLDQQEETEETESQPPESEVIFQNQTVAVNVPISAPTQNHCTVQCMPICEPTCIFIQILLNYQSVKQMTIADVIHNFNQTLNANQAFPSQASFPTTIHKKRSFNTAATKLNKMSTH